MESPRQEQARPPSRLAPELPEAEVTMSEDIVPFDTPEEMWTLAPDRRTVRLSVPPVHVAGLLEPLRVLVEFDAEGVDDVLRRLIVLRARMPDVEPDTSPTLGTGSSDGS
jgi:hypothetical protein